MVKLTVIYTLPAGADHDAFLKWRTTEHQKSNMGIPGVLKSDFYAVREIYTHKIAYVDDQNEQKPVNRLEKNPGDRPEKESGGRLEKDPLRYRYMTEAYWPDMESFRAAFFDPEYQKKLMDSLKKIEDPLFLISEEVLSEVK